MNAATVLNFHFILFNPDVIVAVVNVDAAVLSAKPHCRLVNVLLAAVDARHVAHQGRACRVRAWNVIRVRVVGARA